MLMKSLLILTGHSKGLGRAILDQFLDEKNTEVIAVSRTPLDLQRDGLQEIPLDLSDLNALEMQLSKIFPSGDFDRIILINNAGWIGEVKPVGKLHPKGIRQVVNLNLAAPMILCDAFAKAYETHSGQKVIINISSGAASKPLSGWGEYCTSKAGLAMFSKVAAQELGEKGFRVFSLAPGIVDTEMQAEIRQAEESDFPAIDQFKTYKSEGRLSSAEEVARKIYFLIGHTKEFSEVVQDVRNFEAD